MKLDFLPNLRAYLIFSSIPIAMILVASQVYGHGWLSLHPPEIEGGIEVTLENMKHSFVLDAQESKRLEDERKAKEDMKCFDEQMEKYQREHEENVRHIERLEKEMEAEKQWQEQEDRRLKAWARENREKCFIPELDLR